MSAFFVVLLGGSSTTSPVVNVTGVSATGAVGTVDSGTAQQVFLTGVYATGFAGAVGVIADANTAVSGLSASAFIGQAQALAESDIVLTGVSATASPGTLTATGTGFVSLTGVSGQTQLGNESILIGGNITLTVTGLAANGSVGTVNVSVFNNVTVSLTGVASTAYAGSVVVAGSALTSATGVSGTATVRPVAVQASVSTNTIGVSGTGAVGSVVAQTVQTANATGVAATGQVSAVTTSVTAFVSVNVTGVSATANLGAVAARTSDSFIALSTSSSPYVHAYEWDDSSGFGAKFANPASLPVGSAFDIDITTYSGTKYLAAASTSGSSGYASYIYNINGISGWGTRQNGHANQRSGRSVRWINNGLGEKFLVTGCATYAGVGSVNNLYLSKFTGSLVSPQTSYNWFDDGFTNLFFSIAAVTSVGLTSGDAAIIGGFGSVTGGPPSTYLQGISYTESTGGFGTVWTPTSKPQGPVNGVASYDISRTTNPRAVVFAAHDSEPYISAWKVEVSPLAFVRYSNPSSSLPGNANGVSYRSTGASTGQVAVAHDSSPRVSAYTWTTSGGFGTKYSNPVTLPTGNGESVRFNATGTCVAVGHATSPYISVYPWSTASGFGTKFSNPSTAMGATVQAVAFSN